MRTFIQQMDMGITFYVLMAGIWMLVQRYGTEVYGNMLQQGWTDKTLAFLLIGIIPFTVYAMVGIVMYLVDMLPQFKSFRLGAKLQQNYFPNKSAYWKCLKVVAFNWVVLGFPWVGIVMYLSDLRGSATGPTMPTTREALLHGLVYVVVEEILFFHSHWALHHPSVYKHVHKLHHDFKAPFAIAAIYAHPVEHLLSNLIPLSAGPLLCGSHPVLTCMWSCLALVNTMMVHSGYYVPGMPDPSYHDWHHMRFNENYGVMGWFDRLYGTNAKFDRLLSEGKIGRGAMVVGKGVTGKLDGDGADTQAADNSSTGGAPDKAEGAKSAADAGAATADKGREHAD